MTNSLNKKSSDNQLIIIGNGFDLAHGLKTSYNDFMYDYLQNIVFDITDKAGLEISYQDLLFHMHIDSMMNRAVLSKIKQAKSLKDLKKVIDQENNISFSFKCQSKFAKELFNSIERWVDIEDTFYKNLKRIIKSEPSTEEVEDIRPELFKQLNCELNYLKEMLHTYLLKVTTEVKNFLRIPNDFFIRDTNVRNIYDTKKLYFLNFNYTFTTDQYLDYYFDEIIETEVNHIHGVIDGDVESMVFGFGDEKDKSYREIEELNMNVAFRYIKSFEYFHSNQYRKLMSYINSGEFDVSIMGHSCGLSDRTMLSTIFEHENCKSIRICYYQKEGDITNKSDYTEKTYEISRLFDDKKEMRSKILPFSPDDRIPQFDDKN